MEYNFYGSDNANIKDDLGLTPKNYYDLLSNIWSKDTCAPRLRDEWSIKNRTLGQCSITSFLIQDIYGGEVYGIPLGDGNYHCFNRINDIEFDLTSEQFPNKLDYTTGILQKREDHFKREEKYNRYLLLKKELEEVIEK